MGSYYIRPSSAVPLRVRGWHGGIMVYADAGGRWGLRRATVSCNPPLDNILSLTTKQGAHVEKLARQGG